jgi:CBS domain containing-hemolysin-like protein
MKEGYSRIPIYDGTPQNVKKVLLVKTLITVNPEDRISIRSVFDFDRV